MGSSAARGPLFMLGTGATLASAWPGEKSGGSIAGLSAQEVEHIHPARAIQQCSEFTVGLVAPPSSPPGPPGACQS